MIDFSDLRYCVGSKPISNKQQPTLKSFLLLLINGLSLRTINVLYRGEKFSSLGERLGSSNKREILDRLFFIGDKAKHYWKQSYESSLEDRQMLRIDDVSDEIFIYIVKKYKKIFKSKREVIIDFKRNNPLFVKFFEKGGDSQSLVEMLRSSNTITRLVIRDYLLIPLHHIGNIGLGPSSPIVSTSIDSRVAREFSGTGPGSVSIVAWRSLKAAQVQRSKAKNILKNFSIPLYEIPFYPKQKEISMKAGILPHYIVGLIDHQEKIFHVNPHLFNAERIDSDLLVNGFPVDQGDFDEMIKTTAYRGSYVVIDGNRFYERVHR